MRRYTGASMFGPDLIDKSFTEALSGLALQLSAGVPLDKALRSAGPINRTITGRRAFEAARESVMRGESFDRALEAMSAMLSYPDRAMLAAGWHGGRIDEALRRVVQRRELMRQSRSYMRRQFILPGVVLLAAALIAPLPPFLLGHIGFTAYLFRAMPPLIIAGGIYLTVRTVQQKAARRWSDWHGDQTPPPATPIDTVLLTVPLCRGVERKRNLSEFAMLMFNLLAAGMGLIDALRTTARALPNGLYRLETLRLVADIAEGSNTSRAMQQSHLWPREWIDALEVGETTGGEDTVLARLGESMRESYMNTIRAWAQWLPRVVYAIVALYVVFQILSMWASLPRPH